MYENGTTLVRKATEKSLEFVKNWKNRLLDVAKEKGLTELRIGDKVEVRGRRSSVIVSFAGFAPNGKLKVRDERTGARASIHPEDVTKVTE